jgi:hypothetical protein
LGHFSQPRSAGAFQGLRNGAPQCTWIVPEAGRRDDPYRKGAKARKGLV